MTVEERNVKLKHLITCVQCAVSGKVCDKNCPTQHAAGSMGEIVENLDIENLEAISEILEQETCEDAVSREAVMNILGDSINDDKDYRRAVVLLNNLSPVTPRPKTGRWISFGIQGEIDGQIVRAFTCSQCGAISIFRVSNGNIVNGDLCPNCGAKMQEVENDTN